MSEIGKTVAPFLANNPAASAPSSAQPDFQNLKQKMGDETDLDKASVRPDGRIYQPQASEVSKKVGGPVTGPMGPGEGPRPFKGLK